MLHRQRLAGGLWLLALVLGFTACHSPGVTPGPWPPVDTLTPGTDPPPQPSTTPYPQVERSAAWGMDGGDQFNSKRVAVAGPVAPQLVSRTVQEGEISGGIQLGADGRLYVAAGRCVVILSQAGQRLGSLELAAWPDYWGLHAISGGGLCYVGEDGLLRAIDEQGAELWQYDFGDRHLNRPEFDAAGNFVVQDNTGKLYAISPQGELVWSYQDPQAENPYQFDWSLAADGTVYGIAYGHNLKAIRAGTVVWEVAPRAGLGAEVYAGANGHVYVHSINEQERPYQRQEYLEVFDTAGQWLAQTQICDADGVSMVPTITGLDGAVYGGMSYDSISAFNADGSLKWRYSGHVYTGNRFALGPDGSLYTVVMGLRGYDFDLCCFSPAGALVWNTPTHFNSGYPPLLQADGSLVLAQDEHILCFTSSGAPAWTYGVHVPYLDGLVFDGAGNSFLSGSCLVSQNAGGAERWRTAYGDTTVGAPAISPQDGGLYTVGGKYLAARDTNGAIAWSHSTGGENDYLNGLIIGADGTLLVQGINGSRSLGAFTSSGAKQWIYTDEHEIAGRPAIDAEGNIYFLSDYTIYPPPIGVSFASQFNFGWQASWLKSLARNGAPRWSVPLGTQPFAAPVIADDGAVLLPEGGGTLSAYSAADGSPRWNYSPLPHMARQAVLGQDGVCYVLCSTQDEAAPADGATTAIHAVNAHGAAVWQAEIEGWFSTAQADSAGRLYLSTGADYSSKASAYIIDADGTQLWELPDEFQPPAGGMSLALRLDPLGRLHVLSQDLHLVFADTAD